MINRKRIPLFFLLLTVVACAPTHFLKKSLQETEQTFQDHVGFVLYDPVTRKTLFDQQGNRYFTPASNTKIFTFYASLKLLGDSVPALHYTIRNDSLIFWGTGDPSFLYKDAHHSDRVVNFLMSRPEKLFFSTANYHTEHFGQGWAWDDYQDSYQAERSSFPMYGNRFTLSYSGATLTTTPPVFAKTLSVSEVIKEKPEFVRGIGSNDLKFTNGQFSKTNSWDIPFHGSPDLYSQLLMDTIKRAVQLINLPLPSEKQTIYSVPTDSLYKVLMQASDNFVAEQLLLLCADALSDSLKPEIAIREVKKQFLADSPDEVLWVDGSGLSRYNLFTPRTIVTMWDKIYVMVPRERLFHLLARGGETGTIKRYFKSENPFIFGKTGTLSNNYSLSGYLVTRKGRTLIFSWMNSNFATSTGKVRGRMEEILKQIYEKL